MTTLSPTVHSKAGRGDWIRTSDLHTPSVMRYQAALRPDWLAHLGSAIGQGKVAGGDRVGRRRRKGKSGKWVGRALTAMLALPMLYMIGALIGSIVPVNRGWTEAREGTTIYIADNGIHSDIIMPVGAQGLDWAPLLPRSDFAAAPVDARWIAFGSGERHVYLDTPTWWDITPRTIRHSLIGGRRVMHVEYVLDPYYAVRQIRLRPEEYRRLWSAIRADFALDARGRPQKIDHRGYGPADAFYRATGTASAIRTGNAVVAHWLRLAGVKTSVWPPFVNGLTWRYRKARA
jgi:uncharacterized protein (TIGR02117 family)